MSGRHAPASKTKNKNLLFLKKKKQKDFTHFAPSLARGPAQMDESFLVLFCKKEHASCLW